MFETLDLQSSCARRMLLERPMMVKKEEIEKEYAILKASYEHIYQAGGNVNGFSISSIIAHIKSKLQGLRDVYSTISRLKDNAVLDDVELFEIKYLSFLSQDVAERLGKIELDTIVLPDVQPIISILDPDGLNLRTFYVYDSYSEELAALRLKIKRGEEANGAETHQKLLDRAEEIENQVRRTLSESLKAYADVLKETLEGLSRVDILLAKTGQIKKMGLCFPVMSENGITSYNKMFHPQVEEALKKNKKEFTPVDIEFGIEPVTIIGANMGGKTVVLKMLALNQLLCQFGFGISAQSACIDIKDNVFFCIGDEQNTITGLSSFAAEMKSIDTILDYLFGQAVQKGKNGKIIALIDEPARTTNPVEGRALVEALVNILKGENLSALLTTHYNVACEGVKKLRVRGLVDGRMDYRLAETKTGDIPHEAINIAKSLGINRRWIEEAERRMKENEDHI